MNKPVPGRHQGLRSHHHHDYGKTEQGLGRRPQRHCKLLTIGRAPTFWRGGGRIPVCKHCADSHWARGRDSHSHQHSLPLRPPHPHHPASDCRWTLHSHNYIVQTAGGAASYAGFHDGAQPRGPGAADCRRGKAGRWGGDGWWTVSAPQAHWPPRVADDPLSMSKCLGHVTAAVRPRLHDTTVTWTVMAPRRPNTCQGSTHCAQLQYRSLKRWNQ